MKDEKIDENSLNKFFKSYLGKSGDGIKMKVSIDDALSIIFKMLLSLREEVEELKRENSAKTNSNITA